MKASTYKALLAILLFVTAIPALNAQISFTVNAPAKVPVGEKFAVTYRIKNGEGSGLKVPQINGCTQIFGPAVSSSDYKVTEHIGVQVGGQIVKRTYSNRYEADPIATPYIMVGRKKKIGIGLPVGQILQGFLGK